MIQNEIAHNREAHFHLDLHKSFSIINEYNKL